MDPFIVPTVGFSAPVKKTLFGYDVVFYDLGGGARIRGVWPQYFADVHGIVFVVDCADPSRLPEASKELHSAMNHPMIVGKPLLMCVPSPFPVEERHTRCCTPCRLPTGTTLTHAHTHPACAHAHPPLSPLPTHPTSQLCQQDGRDGCRDGERLGQEYESGHPGTE